MDAFIATSMDPLARGVWGVAGVFILAAVGAVIDVCNDQSAKVANADFVD